MLTVVKKGAENIFPVPFCISFHFTFIKFVSTPTHFIAGEGKPEMIIDYPTLKNIQLKAPEIIPLIHSLRVKEYAEGKYPDIPAPHYSTNTTSSHNDTLLLEMVAMLKDIKRNTENTCSFKDLYDKLDEVDAQYQQFTKNFIG